MKSDSQQIIFIPLFMFVIIPWIGLHFLIHVCYLKYIMHILKLGCFNVPFVFPMYSYWSASLANRMNYYRFCILVHICHQSLLFCGILSQSWLYILLVVWKALFNLVYLNKLMPLCISGLWYVKVTHFFFCFVSVCVTFVCCVLSISLFFRLWIIHNGKLLFLVLVRTMFHSCCFACSVIGSIIILFMWKMYTASLCSDGWLDVKCIIVSLLCGFSVNS
jgi:hypothetical protein